ncbi:magnesium and cobalt transport protein [Fusarium austroafricanum]|uniref:Magnesium and cobalt transport protein n=1 Tax=Fusarium austroafricanum TaxID=2364996 RepID=A0A8H4KT93_9HYPO|nr:magnesium and cobalt transport protein [Fusarium austroafricanum]
MNLFGDFEAPFLLLLVDPPLGKFVVGANSRQHRQVEPLSPDHVYPGIVERSLRLVADEGKSWYMPIPAAHPAHMPEMKSMFDDIVALYPYRPTQSSADPLTATDICRQLVLSAWVARLRITEAEVAIRQTHMTTDPSMDILNYRNWMDGSWMHAWTPRDFGGLVRAKTSLERMDLRLLYNMDALGVGKTNSITEEWEAEAWKRLRDTLLTLKMRVDILLQAYTQAVSARESQIANKQARQVGYLTSLATFFVPMSFVAAVFSMGGDYAAGEKKFYVFWVISVPIAVLAFSVFFFKGPISKLMPIEEEGNVKESAMVKDALTKLMQKYSRTPRDGGLPV